MHEYAAYEPVLNRTHSAFGHLCRHQSGQLADSTEATRPAAKHDIAIAILFVYICSLSTLLSSTKFLFRHDRSPAPEFS